MSNVTPSSDQTKHQGPAHKLGVAGGMAQAFIHSPLSPLLLVACLALGLLGLILTPRQEDPQISVPMVDIFVQYAGASSEQVSVLVVDPLERIMSEISGVKHVYSASMRGSAMVTVEFDVGENLEVSVVKLRDKIMSNMDKIPPGVQPPLIKPKAVDDVPLAAFTLWSNDINDSALRILALDVMQRLKEVENTSQGFVVGGRSEQIRVEVLPERLTGFGIGMDQIAQTIQTANSEQGVGTVESGDTGMQIYTGSFLRNARDISRLVVGTHNNAPVYVSDVARVIAGPEDTERMVTYYTGPAYEENTPKASGAQAVTIAIAKKIGSNGVAVANQLLERMAALQGSLIPSNVYVSVTRNYGETAREKVNGLLIKLAIATLAVTALIIVFLGFRPAMVTLIVIPVVILMTVFAAMIFGYTIDRVSLFALIFSIGILVDDAIVVVENIYRRWLIADKCCPIISVDAVREVGNPTILATFTVIAALLPMGFVRGMMGPYMEPIPALGSVAMLFSLFAAFIFTPWLAQVIKPSMRTIHKQSQSEHRQAEAIEKFYRATLPPLIYDKKKGYGFLFGLIAVFFICMSMFYTTAVTVKILPLDNKPEFNVVINMPEGTALPKTANMVQRLTEEIRDRIPEVTALQTYVGTASPFNFNGMVRHYYLRSEAWQGDIQVQLLHKDKRKRTSHDIAVQVREILTPIAQKLGGLIQVVEMPPGPPVLQSVVAEVTGPTDSIRRQVAEDMTAMFRRTKTIVDVDNYMQDSYQIWRFEVDTEKAVRRGVSVDAINRNLAMATGGFKLGDVKRGSVQEPTYIILQVPLEIRSQVANLSDLPIATPGGKTIPLGELGRFVRSYQDPVIYHKDLRPVEYVTGEVVGELDAPIYAMAEVEKMLESYRTPDGVTGMKGEMMGPPANYAKSGFEWTGEWTVTYETFRDMGMAFGAALILIYMLVVWEFGNFTLPAIIMAPIPLTLIGIIPGHWLFDAKFTATSMIGFIALAGIIVRNSILLVDFTQQEVMRGTPILEAVILSCKARTRPILITALALVAGSSVIVTDFIFQGMAISLLFGALVSTVLTLIVIPLGCVSARNVFNMPESSIPAMERGEFGGEAAPTPRTDGAAQGIADDMERQKRLKSAKAFVTRYAPAKKGTEPQAETPTAPPPPPTEVAAETVVDAVMEEDGPWEQPVSVASDKTLEDKPAKVEVVEVSADAAPSPAPISEAQPVVEVPVELPVATPAAAAEEVETTAAVEEEQELSTPVKTTPAPRRRGIRLKPKTDLEGEEQG